MGSQLPFDGAMTAIYSAFMGIALDPMTRRALIKSQKVRCDGAWGKQVKRGRHVRNGISHA